MKDLPGDGITDLLLRVMGFIGAPLVHETVLNDLSCLEDDDCTIDLLREELDFFKKFQEGGLKAFASALEMLSSNRGAVISESHDEGGILEKEEKALGAEIKLCPTTNNLQSKISVLTYLMPFFISRTHKLAENLEKIASKCQQVFLGGEMNPELVDEIRRLEVMVENKARPAPDPQLDQVLDLNPNSNWTLVKLAKNSHRIQWEDDIKAGGGGGSGRGSASSASTGVSVGSTGGGGQFGQRRQHRAPTGYIKFNPKELMEDSDDDEGVRAKDGGAVGDQDADELKTIRRQRSSFDDRTVEINDKESDPNWHDQQRQSLREVRVRRRIPTGHPSMMKYAISARRSLSTDDEET